MKKYYIIYEVVKDKDGNIIDLINTWDNMNLQRVCDRLGVTYNHYSDYSTRSLNNIKCKLKDNKYFIYKGHTTIEY